MIVLALVVGAVTAWYLGNLRLGLIAAAVSAAALLAAMVIPGASVPVYALLALWCLGVWFFKTKLQAFAQPPAEKKGWQGEVDRWKRRVTWFINNRK